MSMRIITVSMVKNEEAMIEFSLRYWLTFSDMIIVFDHNSMDGTPEILMALQEEYPGRIVPFHPDCSVVISYMQAEITNKMIETAIMKYDADIVIPLDADEFPILSGHRDISVRALFESLDQECVYFTFWLLFGLPENEKINHTMLAPLSFHKKRTEPIRRFPKFLITRGSYMADPVCVTIGNHNVYRSSGNKLCSAADLSSRLIYAHYMFRSISHWKSKCAVGWIANYSKATFRQGEAEHYRLAVQQILNGEVNRDSVDFAALTVQGMTEESKAHVSETTEMIEPGEYFPPIPLLYTEMYKKNNDEFIQLLETVLLLIEQNKAAIRN